MRPIEVYALTSMLLCMRILPRQVQRAFSRGVGAAREEDLVMAGDGATRSPKIKRRELSSITFEGLRSLRIVPFVIDAS